MNETASFAQDVSYQAEYDALVVQKSLSLGDLALAIKSLLDHPEQYHHMSLAALQAASDIKSYQQLADAVIGSVKEACE